ncbi:MAG: NAD(P)/FAD-dependent oxidoreductase [Oscillospiraceae bacterium]|jgi:thioredoxin reductase (NADPH)|nr:NAD(P)/FAD-dependent oxidoreductase [Oscillospiraceae bacterium]
MEFDTLILGGGPAGCSAALYLCRAGLRTAIVFKDGGALERAEKIENYFGLPTPLTGAELTDIGRAQAQALGASLLEAECTNLIWEEDGTFAAECAGIDTIRAKTALLTTGKPKRAPSIAGIDAFTGKGVSYCAVCDAFLYRNRRVAVLGGGAYALHELSELLPLAKEVTVLTNGAPPQFEVPNGVEVRTRKILKLDGDVTLSRVVLEDGELPCDGLFVALGSASSNDFAKKLGLTLGKNESIQVDDKQRTGLPGLFAAGDCTGAFAQVSIAVASGATAAMSIIQSLRA